MDWCCCNKAECCPLGVVPVHRIDTGSDVLNIEILLFFSRHSFSKTNQENMEGNYCPFLCLQGRELILMQGERSTAHLGMWGLPDVVWPFPWTVSHRWGKGFLWTGSSFVTRPLGVHGPDTELSALL